VKDGLNIKSRIDQNGIFKSIASYVINLSILVKQPPSQELTMADTTGHSNQMKRSLNHNGE